MYEEYCVGTIFMCIFVFVCLFIRRFSTQQPLEVKLRIYYGWFPRSLFSSLRKIVKETSAIKYAKKSAYILQLRAYLAPNRLEGA